MKEHYRGIIWHCFLECHIPHSITSWAFTSSQVENIGKCQLLKNVTPCTLHDPRTFLDVILGSYYGCYTIYMYVGIRRLDFKFKGEICDASRWILN